MNWLQYALQTLVPLSKIASRSSACAKRGLKVHSELKTYGNNESIITWRTHFFTKGPDGESLKATRALLRPLIESTIVRNGGLSLSKPDGSVGLDRMAGLSGGGALLSLQNASFLRGKVL